MELGTYLLDPVDAGHRIRIQLAELRHLATIRVPHIYTLS